MKKIYSYQCYLFDFDGVIVDANEIKAQAFAEIYKPFGEAVAEKVLNHNRLNHGTTRIEKFRHYHQIFLGKQLSDDELQGLSKKFSDYAFSKILEAPLICGVEEFLVRLSSLNKKMFIASNAPEAEVNEAIQQKNLKKYFLAIKGAPLPKVKNIEQILLEHGFNIVDCVFFGDTESDLQAAKSLCVDFVPINYFNKSIGHIDFNDLMGNNK